MSNLSSSIRWDMKLQYKYGLYIVTGIVTFLYVLLLMPLPENLLDRITVFIIFTDPALLGFLFIGALVLFEKSERTLDALTVTPLKVDEYMVSKMVSLSILALGSSLIIVLFSHGLTPNFPAFVTGVLLTSLFFTLIGFIAVVRFNTLNEYFLTQIFYMGILNLPLLDYFGILKSPVFYAIPTQASLILLRSAFGEVATWEILYSVIYLLLWIGITYVWAKRAFYRYIILKQKGGLLGGVRGWLQT